MATLRDLHVLAFRLPDDAVASTTTAQVDTSSMSPLVVNSVSAGSATTGSAWLMLGTIVFDTENDDVATAGIEYAHDATVRRRTGGLLRTA